MKLKELAEKFTELAKNYPNVEVVYFDHYCGNFQPYPEFASYFGEFKQGEENNFIVGETVENINAISLN